MKIVDDHFVLRGEDVLVTACYLKSRRWTTGMIRQLLPPPRHREHNPHVAIAAGQRLWPKEHVEEIERREHFDSTRGSSQEQSEQAKSQRRALAETVVTFAQNMAIELGDRQRIGEAPLKNRTKKTTALVLSGGKWTAHDLRRTAGTMMATLGICNDVIHECLNHIQNDRKSRVYIRDRRESEQARAFDALGVKLASIVASPKSPGDSSY